ncbi:MAG: hypothetical protein PHZ17_03380 [Sulfurovum sp.]|nr:hypothetical protein [Sulfurovum sp.]
MKKILLFLFSVNFFLFASVPPDACGNTCQEGLVLFEWVDEGSYPRYNVSIKKVDGDPPEPIADCQFWGMGLEDEFFEYYIPDGGISDTHYYTGTAHYYYCTVCQLPNIQFPNVDNNFSYGAIWNDTLKEDGYFSVDCENYNGVIEEARFFCHDFKRCKFPKNECIANADPFPDKELGYVYLDPIVFDTTEKINQIDDYINACFDLGGDYEYAYIDCKDQFRCKKPAEPCDNPLLIRNQDGLCVCPLSYQHWDDNANSCVDNNVSDPCPDGFTWDSQTFQCIPEENENNSSCLPGQYLTSAGYCEYYDCPVGYIPGPTYEIDYICVPEEEDEEEENEQNQTLTPIDSDKYNKNDGSVDSVNGEIETTYNPDGTKTVKKSMKNGDGSLTTETSIYDQDGNLISRYTETHVDINPENSAGSITVDNPDGTKTVVNYEKNSDGTYNKTVTYYDQDGNILYQKQEHINPDDNFEGVDVVSEEVFNEDGTTTTKTGTKEKENIPGGGSVNNDIETNDITDYNDTQKYEDPKIIIYPDHGEHEGNLSSVEENLSNFASDNNFSDEENESVDYLSELANLVKNEMKSVYVNDIISSSSVSISALRVTIFGNTYTFFDPSTIPNHVWEILRTVIKFVAIISAIVIVFSSI